MDRYRILIKETWWLWLLLFVFGTVMTILVAPIFWVTFPISIATFLWFGYVRFDENGKFRGS